MDDSICEECGREFASQQGKRQHYTMKHRDSATVSVSCSWCGSTFEKNHRHVDNAGDYSIDNHFCSKKCESSYKTEHWVGKNHPSYDGGKSSVVCEECGESYCVKPCNVDKTRFCSEECHNQNRTNPVVSCVCGWCESEFTRKAYNIKGDSVFCNAECFSLWLSERRSGDGNTQWAGGKETYYGKNWTNERRKALESSGYECDLCGMARKQHYAEYGFDLEVHHRIPIRSFETVEDANFQSNLVVCCRNCHQSTLEADPVPHNTIRAPVTVAL